MTVSTTTALLCPECNSVLRRHAPDQGYCLFGHGVITFREDGKGVITKPLTVRLADPQDKFR